ncbi:hypothetical protein Q1695_005818 [Nippostrongylus brasiliensis]|nr:hypothetical protein Q1695_005818 [Nippostrongylus brasiliensis]
MLFRDVVPEADETIGKLGFDNVYSLARLISIYECERSADRKRLRMRDARYAFVTVNGIEKAFTFFKRYCDHVFRSLTLHDGSPILLPYSENTEIPIDQLNDLNTQGVKYAMAHDWKDVVVKEAVQKVLIVLPDGFRHIQATDEALEVSTYKRFSEISEVISRMEPRHIVFVGPTTEKPLHRSSWLKLATSFAKAALAGAKVVVVAPPRGEGAWKQSRLDAREMVDVARMSAMSMRNNIIGMIPLLESIAEPFQAVGLHPRRSSEDVYPNVVVEDYLTAPKDYVQSEVVIPKFWEKTEAALHRDHHKKTARPRTDRVRGGVTKKGNFKHSQRGAQMMMPMMVAPPFPNFVPQMPYLPSHSHINCMVGRGRRGRGRGGRRL